MPALWWPEAVRRELTPESTTEPLRVPTQFILHSIVGSAEGALRMFQNSSSLESTFIFPKVGRPWQLLPINREADANLEANRSAVSAETEDNGHPDTDPWNDNQLHWIVELGLWLKSEWSIPTDHAITKGRCFEGGTGYHSLHHLVDASGVWTANCWTPSRGKTCPGLIRIHQFETIIMPALRAGRMEDTVAGLVFNSREEFVAAVKDGAVAAQNEATIFGQPNWMETVRDVIVAGIRSIDARTNDLAVKLTDLAAQQSQGGTVNLSPEQLDAIVAELRATGSNPDEVLDKLQARLAE